MAKMSVTGTPGTSSLSLNGAVSGFQDFATAGVVDQETVSYSISDTGNTWEVGRGVYSASGPSLSRGPFFSSGGASQTWNPSQISSHLTLSNSNLTATNTAANTQWQSAAGVVFVSSGHYYFEVAFPVLTSIACTIGIANSSGVVTDFYMGADGNSLSINSIGQIFYNAAQQSSGGTSWSQNDRIGCAFSRTYNKIWWKNITTSAGWNNDVIGNQNPATNTGGFALPTGLNDHAVSVASGVGNSSNVDSFTGYFTATAWLGTAPSGFGPTTANSAISATSAAVVSIVVLADDLYAHNTITHAFLGGL